MRKIICNADDFGHSKGVNLGIIEAFKNGIVRSTTLMAGMDGFEHALVLAKDNPGLNIGVHLTLTAGKSVGGIYKTITDEKGNFLNLSELENNIENVDLLEVEHEYEAQIQKILDAGIKVDHFDSHHHTHNLKGIINIFLKLAKKYNKKVRIYDKNLLTGEYANIKTTDVFVDTFFDDTVSIDSLKKIIDEHKNGSMEIMCHPAYLDYTLRNTSSYNIKRTDELNVLTSPEILRFIKDNNIEVVSFSEI